MFRRKHPTRRELEHLIVELREILDEQERLLARLSAFPRLARWPGWTVPRRQPATGPLPFTFYTSDEGLYFGAQ